MNSLQRPPNQFGELHYPNEIKSGQLLSNDMHAWFKFYQNRFEKIVCLNQREGTTSSTGKYWFEIPDTNQINIQKKKVTKFLICWDLYIAHSESDGMWHAKCMKSESWYNPLCGYSMMYHVIPCIQACFIENALLFIVLRILQATFILNSDNQLDNSASYLVPCTYMHAYNCYSSMAAYHTRWQDWLSKS